MSSVNLEYFDEWKDDELFIFDMINMLDNIIEHFIDNAMIDTGMNVSADSIEEFSFLCGTEDKTGFAKAAYSSI